MTSVERFRAMGCDVVVGGADQAELGAIRALFEDRERTFSRFRAGSELNRVNAASGSTVVVSELFAQTLHDAVRAAAQTQGLVDPTLAVALEHAGYDRDFALMRSEDFPAGPGAPGLVAAVHLNGRILSRPSGVKLDLNGVVKARAVDDALDLLAGAGFVAAGGDVAARGGALIGLPGAGSLELHDGGVATSGTSRRRWRRNGVVQHHLIDPATGRPSASIWTLVTVAAGSCRDADVAAKAAFLLGVDGPAWLDERSLPGRFCSPAGEITNRTWQAVLGPPVNGSRPRANGGGFELLRVGPGFRDQPASVRKPAVRP
jgi:thiamine biosynthesis lipoprotein